MSVTLQNSQCVIQDKQSRISGIKIASKLLSMIENTCMLLEIMEYPPDERSHTQLATLPGSDYKTTFRHRGGEIKPQFRCITNRFTLYLVQVSKSLSIYSRADNITIAYLEGKSRNSTDVANISCQVFCWIILSNVEQLRLTPVLILKFSANLIGIEALQYR